MTTDKPARTTVPAFPALLRKARLRIVVPVAVLAVGVIGGVAGAVALSGGSGSFVVQAVSAPPVLPGGTVSQSVAGLWEGDQVSEWSKVDGPAWLSVSDEGTVTGTAPATAPEHSELITVQAGGDHAARIKVSVPVVAPEQKQRLEAASWNLDDAGAHASFSAQKKELLALVAEGIQVLGVQEAGGTAAKELAADLGWHYWQAAPSQDGGDLGLVSAYPISDVVEPTATVPAAAATIDVNGQHVRVWVTHLDEADYGPDRACNAHAADLAAHEATTVRAAEATAVAAAMSADLTASAGSAGVPVLLLGDLASPSAKDWTAATSASHCDAGPVAWPVPAIFAAAGLTDSYRAAFDDPAAHPGATWSQDRIDYVSYAGALLLAGAESYRTSAGTWPSDHAAAITLFELTAAHSAHALAHGSGDSGTTATPSSHPSAGDGSADDPLVTELPVGSLAVTGTPVVGSTLRASTAAWPAGATFSYQWFANGAPVRGATAATFAPTAAQVGRQVSVRTTAKHGQQTGTVTVAGPVVRAGRLAHTRPRITGAVKVGKVLRAHAGSWAPAPKLSYQWYANGKPVKGATKATFKPTRTQRGKHITVKITATKPGFSPVAVASAATKKVRS
jgi:hypothetical protein